VRCSCGNRRVMQVTTLCAVFVCRRNRTVTNELWMTELDHSDAHRSGIDHVWTHVGGGPSFAAESSCDSPPSWSTMFWDYIGNTGPVHDTYAGASVCPSPDWPRARIAAQSWTIGENEQPDEALLFSGWYTSPCGFTSTVDSTTGDKVIAMLPADLWKFNTVSHCWQLLGGAFSNVKQYQPTCSPRQCGSLVDVESHSITHGPGDEGELVNFSHIKRNGSATGFWAVDSGSSANGPGVGSHCRGRSVTKSTKWPLGRWSAQTWTISTPAGLRMYLFSGRLHIQGEGVRCTDAGRRSCLSDYLLNDLWSLRRYITLDKTLVRRFFSPQAFVCHAVCIATAMMLLCCCQSGSHRHELTWTGRRMMKSIGPGSSTQSA
jgi:hypothetical protein